MKKIKPAYVISFVIAFTIFIYEPILLYAKSNADLWFDFKTLLKPILLLFISTFIFFIVVYKVISLFSKKKTIYNIILVMSFIGYFASYIQGNYMLKKLPPLDGSTIVYHGFFVQNVISICIWLTLILIHVICIKKFKFEKVLNVSKYVATAILIMLTVSLTSTMLTTKNMFTSKLAVTSMDKYFADYSNNKNFIIFVTDAIDSEEFAKLLKTSKYKNMLNDFTYFPDTLSYYAFTRESIPLMLSGVPNYNKTDYYTYYNKALDKSPFLNRLIKEDYNINIYDFELKWSTKKGKKVTNAYRTPSNVKFKNFTENILRYVAYRYLPFKLKEYAHIELMDFNNTKDINNDTIYYWENTDNYKYIKNSTIKKDDQKRFKFIHVAGAHTPFDEDEELNKVDEEKSSYEKEILSSMKLVDTYLKWLKESDIYDNSVIILMADHGYFGWSITGRQNPILYIKGFNEKHDKMEVSDKKVSHIDLMDAYDDLMDGKKSTQLFKNLKDNRVRKFIYYQYTKEDHMVEYTLDGHAWEDDKLVKTGREFNR